MGEFGDLLFLISGKPPFLSGTAPVNIILERDFMTAEFLAAATTLAKTGGEIPNWFAVVMGIGTVFVGLLSIIIICVITGAVCGNKRKDEKISAQVNTDSSIDPRKRQEIIAAVCAACAEDMGTGVEALKVVSFKKI